ncbi:ORF41 [Ranid herpesvirus 1]|uniref:ORF41 n=1 Tax=Ranid herpesvirus 1 TaxID=85655 RepID=Q14VR7_9VIRU|nr:ORF41 [Ranid herpesvirus 1]ABG25739.1 ORF41 [Ranid herpesvirus 1]
MDPVNDSNAQRGRAAMQSARNVWGGTATLHEAAAELPIYDVCRAVSAAHLLYARIVAMTGVAGAISSSHLKMSEQMIAALALDCFCEGMRAAMSAGVATAITKHVEEWTQRLGEIPVVLQMITRTALFMVSSCYGAREGMAPDPVRWLMQCWTDASAELKVPHADTMEVINVVQGLQGAGDRLISELLAIAIPYFGVVRGWSLYHAIFAQCAASDQFCLRTRGRVASLYYPVSGVREPPVVPIDADLRTLGKRCGCDFRLTSCGPALRAISNGLECAYHRPTAPEASGRSSPCGARMCAICPYVAESDKVVALQTQNSVAVKGRIDCGSQGGVYVLTCCLCGVQHVGSTTSRLEKDLGRHIRAMTAASDTEYSGFNVMRRHVRTKHAHAAGGPHPCFSITFADWDPQRVEEWKTALGGEAAPQP